MSLCWNSKRNFFYFSRKEDRNKNSGEKKPSANSVWETREKWQSWKFRDLPGKRFVKRQKDIRRNIGGLRRIWSPWNVNWQHIQPNTVRSPKKKFLLCSPIRRTFNMSNGFHRPRLAILLIFASVLWINERPSNKTRLIVFVSLLRNEKQCVFSNWIRIIHTNLFWPKWWDSAPFVELNSAQTFILRTQCVCLIMKTLMTIASNKESSLAIYPDYGRWRRRCIRHRHQHRNDYFRLNLSRTCE